MLCKYGKQTPDFGGFSILSLVYFFILSLVYFFILMSFNSYVSYSYLVELMFRLELDVQVYSSFDRSGTTGFKCSYLPASLLIVCSAQLKNNCHSTQLYLKLLLRIQHEVPFINTSEATKWSSDRTENGKCINITNRRIRVFYKILLSALTEICKASQQNGNTIFAFQ